MDAWLVGGIEVVVQPDVRVTGGAVVVLHVEVGVVLRGVALDGAPGGSGPQDDPAAVAVDRVGEDAGPVTPG